MIRAQKSEIKGQMTEKGAEIALLIDHTLLRPDATRREVVALCSEARNFGFAAVCVNPSFVRVAAHELSNSPVKVGTVIGFPLGASTTETKAFEAKDAILNGAQELDMVLAIAELKDHNNEYVLNDIKAVVKAGEERVIKVILETCLLTDEEKVTACKLVVKAGAHFVKTSTGLAEGGATVEDIRLMRRTVGPEFGVKASGGIRSLDDALKMIDAGATRIGTSCGVAIVT